MINLHERMLPTSAGVEPATSWSPVGRRIQLSHRGRPVAVPLVQQRNLILQQDNARPHVARVCQDFLANNNIAPLAWPPYSPDLTPIEHMWDELDRRVRKRRNPPATLAQLRNALIDEWNNIPMRTVNALVNSIQRRIRAATAARGGTPDIDFQFDFDFKIWGVATNELQ